MIFEKHAHNLRTVNYPSKVKRQVNLIFQKTFFMNQTFNAVNKLVTIMVTVLRRS